ncbi:MAG: hypothetical protein Q9M50_01960 [Methylococcales bacterium]|nr:hypothetical protein [Methylococcales bacterium]
MKQLKIMAIVIGCSAITNIAVADLQTERSVVNDPTLRISAKANFPASVSGDLYIATQINGNYLFLNDGGKFVPEMIPFTQATEHSGQLLLFDFLAEGSTPGRYPLFQVITNPGTNPLNFNNWVGGLGGLSSLNFTIGLPPEKSGDFNGDGFADDDANKDGFHDDDANKDGFHDDDANKDGFHDDDDNQNGRHDGEENNTPVPTTPIVTAPINVNCSNDNGSDHNGGFESDDDFENDDSFENDGGSDDNCSNIPTLIPTSVPQPISTTGNSIVVEGQTAYASCASAACHGANPAFNQNGVLAARTPSATMSAISRNKGGMGFLSTVITADAANKISSYLNSL